jgi:DUF971 family protein
MTPTSQRTTSLSLNISNVVTLSSINWTCIQIRNLSQSTSDSNTSAPLSPEDVSPLPLSDSTRNIRVTQLRLSKKERTLSVTFDSGEQCQFSAEFLRIESPSAEVQGHFPGQKKLVSGRRNVGIMNLEPVGHYAIRIVFDDLHESGIFSWNYLYELAKNKRPLMRQYIQRLKSANKSRDPPVKTKKVQQSTMKEQR